MSMIKMDFNQLAELTISHWLRQGGDQNTYVRVPGGENISMQTYNNVFLQELEGPTPGAPKIGEQNIL